jgi:hypothetical protein
MWTRSPASKLIIAISVSVIFYGTSIQAEFIRVPNPLEDQSGGRFSAALFALGSVSEGARILKKAIRVWELEDVSDLLTRLKWGPTSRTDMVITRYFNPKTGQEQRKNEITIFLSQDQSQLELIMDIAHELVHATSRTNMDPYDSTLTAGKYILSAIEGEGGRSSSYFDGMFSGP